MLRYGGYPWRLAARQLLAQEARIVVHARQGDGVVVRQEGLNHDTSGLVPAAGPPRDLCKELEGPLAGAKVRKVKSEVRGHNANERHSRNVVALRDHLRANEHVDLAAMKVLQDAALIALAGRGIAVEPSHARVSEHGRNVLLEPLRAKPEQRAVGSPATRTRRSRVLAVATVVTAKLPLSGIVGPRGGPGRVIDERDVAARARDGVPAGEAVHARCKAPAVEEQNCLAASCEHSRQCLPERTREQHCAAASLCLGVHVDDLHLWQRPSGDPLRENESPNRALLAAERRLDVGCRRAHHQGDSRCLLLAGAPRRARGSGSPPRSCTPRRVPRRSRPGPGPGRERRSRSGRRSRSLGCPRECSASGRSVLPQRDRCAARQSLPRSARGSGPRPGA